MGGRIPCGLHAAWHNVDLELRFRDCPAIVWRLAAATRRACGGQQRPQRAPSIVRSGSEYEASKLLPVGSIHRQVRSKSMSGRGAITNQPFTWITRTIMSVCVD